jgi:hypothetical protein
MRSNFQVDDEVGDVVAATFGCNVPTRFKRRLRPNP